MQIQHMATDGRRRQPAIGQQIGPIGVAVLGGVQAEGVQQLMAMHRADPGFAQALVQVHGRDRLGRVRAIDGGGHPVEPAQLFRARQRAIIGDVVAHPREAVEGVNMDAQIRADQERSDREILISLMFAGRRGESG